MSEIIITIFPPMFVSIICLVAFAHRLWVAFRYPVSSIMREEQLIMGFALFNVAVFYVGITLGILHGTLAVAASRFVFIWLAACSLYVTHRIAWRHKRAGNNNNE